MTKVPRNAKPASRLPFDEALEFPEVQEAIRSLKEGLPTLSRSLTYHSLQHTLEVIQDTLAIAEEAGCTRRELELLAVAAAFHDTGFLDTYAKNEPFGAQRATRCLTCSGRFESSEIRDVERMILDTAMVDGPKGPQHFANSKLSVYLLDADLANLGKADFFQKNEQLRLELNLEEVSFLKSSVDFLKLHEWLTAEGERRWEAQKQINQAELLSALSALGALPKDA